MNFTNSSNNIANTQQNNAPQDLEAKKLHILMKMKESKMYWKLKQHLFKEMKTKQQQDNFSVKKIQQASYSSGIEEQLKQLIINCANRSLKSEPIKFDSLDFINQARSKWTEIVLKNYDYAQEKLKSNKPSGVNGGQNNETEQSEILYVYDEKNFFNFMITIKNTSAVNLNMSPNTCMKVNFITPSLSDLRQKYDHLLNSDIIENKNTNEYKLREKRCKTLAENEALESEIESLAQGGFSNGERVELYMKYFGIESSSFKHFAKLEEEVDKKELMYDEILLMDSEEVADDDQFFIFQETVERITQAFLRDKEVKDKLKIYSISTEKLNSNDLQKIPSCFMIPMKSISMLVAPLGFCSNKVDIMYMIFKEFYCNFYCYLHSISSQPNGILFLCCIFEELMAHACNKVMNHLASINIEPLRIAFPWFFYCFIGFTSIENIFLLLDRIIGYKSLDILPIFAVGVFKLYQNDILKCKNASDLEKIFSQKIEFPFINCVRATFQ